MFRTRHTYFEMQAKRHCLFTVWKHTYAALRLFFGLYNQKVQIEQFVPSQPWHGFEPEQPPLVAVHVGEPKPV